MFLRKKEETDAASFWHDYEERIHEKVLARTLGRYLSGWAEYPYPLWGLVMATTGGFRFHHFPHEGWIMALSRISTGGEPPREKTLFIPRESITGAKLSIENRWWKKIFTPAVPVLTVHYSLGGTEGKLLIETDRQAESLVENLTPLP
ncbi:MAG: hypothetical protein LBO65_10405 [Spirochaetaceae bacterium]|jgi:hypothetical protein|nr:hypothetical protein [Spirochaetaceae bacterium]